MGLYTIYDFLFYAVMIIWVSFIGLIIYYEIVTKTAKINFSDWSTGLGKTTKWGTIENWELQWCREIKIDNGSALKWQFKNWLLHWPWKILQADGTIIKWVFDTWTETDGFRTYYLEDSTFSWFKKDGKTVGDRKILYSKPITWATLHFNENWKHIPNSIINN